MLAVRISNIEYRLPNAFAPRPRPSGRAQRGPCPPGAHMDTPEPTGNTMNPAPSTSEATVVTKARTHPYEAMFDALKARREQAKNGNVVLRGADRPWLTSRQGRSKYYIHSE